MNWETGLQYLATLKCCCVGTTCTLLQKKIKIYTIILRTTMQIGSTVTTKLKLAKLGLSWPYSNEVCLRTM